MNRFTSTFAVTTLVITLLAAVGLFTSREALHAQTATAAPIAPPMLPLITSYRYWPVQFVQFVGPELPYSMIELDVNADAGKYPLLSVTLTDRATGKRIHYTDSDSLIAAAAPGDETHKAAIAFDAADTDNPGSISTVRFTTADGKPLEWRFVQGSDISEQGSGLNPFPDAKIPIFAYREQGALAGEGTALQIGGTVSTAAVWTEYSHPPYFIPYRGAETEGAHTLIFLPGKQTWTIASAPTSLAQGATWELDGDHGDHRSIHIDKIDGANLTVTSTDRFQPGVHCTLEVTRTADMWSIERARFSPIHDGDKHALTLQFATPLSSNVDNVETALIAGKKKTIASGMITAGGSPSHDLTLNFSNPTWLNGKKMIEDSVVTKDAITLTAHP